MGQTENSIICRLTAQHFNAHTGTNIPTYIWKEQHSHVYWHSLIINLYKLPLLTNNYCVWCVWCQCHVCTCKLCQMQTKHMMTSNKRCLNSTVWQHELENNGLWINFSRYQLDTMDRSYPPEPHRQVSLTLTHLHRITRTSITTCWKSIHFSNYHTQHSLYTSRITGNRSDGRRHTPYTGVLS